MVAKQLAEAEAGLLRRKLQLDEVAMELALMKGAQIEAQNLEEQSMRRAQKIAKLKVFF